MHFLRTLFWVVFAVIAAVLSLNNWTPVTIQLWAPVELVLKLPVLVAIAFLAGLLPGVILHRTSRWQLKRRLQSTERALADMRPPETAPVPPAVIPIAVEPDA